MQPKVSYHLFATVGDKFYQTCMYCGHKTFINLKPYAPAPYTTKYSCWYCHKTTWIVAVKPRD